ncbi:hypothetical protein VTO73DRAFT_10462 [Trametes versicolor]
MPRCRLTLLPREIVLRICFLLRNHDDTWGIPGPPNQPSLAALVTTGKYLSGPALDVLWGTLVSLVPLLVYTLPEDLCAIVPAVPGFRYNGKTIEYQVIFRREPAAEDFSRFSIYASRVKKLGPGLNVSFFKSCDIPFDVWARLVLYGPQPLLPNLRSLSHTEVHLHNLDHPDIAGRGPLYRSEPLFGPRLKEVRVTYGVWPSDDRRPTEVIRSLSYLSTLVESITMCRYDFRHRAEQPSGARLDGLAIGSLLHLVKFDSSDVRIASASLLALGSLPKLQELVICVDPTEYHWEFLPHGKPGSLFPVLRELVLCDIPFEWCVAFMPTIVSSSLWRVYFADDESLTIPGILLEALCASIAHHPSSHNIREVGINACRWHRVRMPQVYQPQDISPLLSLPALQDLSIRGYCIIAPDDALLSAITWAWPDLRSLSFSWPCLGGLSSSETRDPLPGELGYPKATLAGVLLLARYCPYLTSLELPVDIRHIPLLDERRPPITLCPSWEPPLKSLDVSGSTFLADANVSALAMFLSVVFPRLSTFKMNRGDSGTPAEVLRWHRRFLDIRWQERGWMLSVGGRFREPKPDQPDGAWGEGGEEDLDHRMLRDFV